MARVNFNGLILDIRGKVGNQVFKTWKKGVYYVQNISRKPFNPRSFAQEAYRMSFAALANKWQFLSEAEQALWGAAANNIAPWLNPECGVRALVHLRQGKMSGFDFFMRTNILAQSVGQKGVIECPQIPIPSPNPARDLNGYFDGTNLTVSWGDIPDIAPEWYVRIWVYSEQRRFHKQIAGVARAMDKRMQITQVRGKNGLIIPLPDFTDSAALIQADVVDRNTGWASQPGRTIRVRLASGGESEDKRNT